MASHLCKKVEDITTCGICLDTYDRPKVLPCQHSFCHDCLAMIAREKTVIKCSFCQREHVVPETGVAGFMDNLLLKDLIGLELCVDCKKKPSVDDCDHCRQKVCSRCLVAHAKLVTELSLSLNQVKENLSMPSTLEDKMKMWTLRDNLENERTRMTATLRAEALKKIGEVKTLLKRSNYMDSLMVVLSKFYEILGSADAEEKSVALITQKLLIINECTSTNELQYIKNRVTDLKNVLRLIHESEDDAGFEFSYTMKKGMGLVEFGNKVVGLEGQYGSGRDIEDQIAKLVQDCKEDQDTFLPRAENADSLDAAMPGPSHVKTLAEERMSEPQSKKRRLTVELPLDGDQDEDELVDEAQEAVPDRRSVAAGPPAQGPTDEELRKSIACLRRLPQLPAMKKIIRKNPDLYIPELLRKISQTDTRLAQMIRNNRQEVINILNEPEPNGVGDAED